MKTIKAKDATFGRYYEYERGRARCVHTSYEGSSPVFMSRFGLAWALKPTHEITELHEECDSFDWQPAAEGNPNGVRWFARPNLTGNVWCWHVKEQCGEQSCFSAPLKRIDTCYFYFTPEGMLANGAYKEITTAEAIDLIGANGWSQGVAKAKELAGIVDEVEPDAVGVMDSMMNAMGFKRCDAEAATTETNTVLTDLVSGKWKESEEVRWYLDEYENSIRGYWTVGKILFDEDGDSLYANEIADESYCIDDNDIKLTTAQVLCRLARAGHVAAWNEARMLVGMSEQEAYMAGQSVCGLSVGDRVRVTRKAADREMGWDCGCLDGSDVGESMKVREVCDRSYLLDGYYHPYFVLEKIETLADEATPVETPAEVATEIDPGPEHRLINKAVDKPMEGDEFTFDGGATWLPSANWNNGEGFEEPLIYRRRIQPAADHVNKWAGGYWSLGKWVSGRPCGVEVAQ